MADFLEVLELSLSSLKSMQPGGRDDAAVVSKLTDETVFIRGGNGNIFSSEGIVMPLASKIQVKEGDNKKDMKLRLLRGWEEELEADEELTSDEGDSSSCSSSDEDSPVPETPKEDEVKTFIQAEARHKSQSVLSKLRQCSLPGCVKIATLKGLCVAHGGSKRCEHPGCTKKALRGGKCFAHGGGSKCLFQGCIKQALINGMCVAHSGNAAPRPQQDGMLPKSLYFENCGRKFSRLPNCTKKAEARENGNGTKCARSRCINAAIDQGLCIDHSGYVPCSVSGCVTRARVDDKCLAPAYRYTACAKQAEFSERCRGYGRC